MSVEAVLNETEKKLRSEDLKKKTVLIYDHGLLTEYAVRLARDFGKVKYYSTWEDAFPRSNKALIGDGLENVERVLRFWDEVDSADLICAFDTNTSDVVKYLRAKGYRVWGAGSSEILENNRWKARQIQKAVNLPTQKTEQIRGTDNLIEYLKKNKDKWVKINSFRGDIETFHHETYDETEAQFLGKLLHEFGPKGRTMSFTVEDSIGEVEVGSDTWIINGEYPQMVLYGYEQKDLGYVGRVSEFKNIPQSLQNINNKLKPVFKKLGGKTLFSTEARIDKDKQGYLIDNTVRAPLPPSGIHLEMWKNFSEIIWHGADGKIIQPLPAAIYGAELILSSEWAKDNWTLVDFPPNLRPWIKLRMSYKSQEGKYYTVPGNMTLGSVVGLGNTPQEAIDKVKSTVSQIKARDLEYQLDGLNEILKETIPQGRKLGIKF